METTEAKISKYFGVKTASYQSSVKEINDSERTIKAIANTYFYIDSDQDMLIPGCAKKSIADRGPLSSAVAKIKHQADHNLNTRNAVGRITVLDERKYEGNDVLYFESFIPDTMKGENDLGNYQEGLFDNHSIGFRYKQLELAERDSQEAEWAANWAKYYPMALNPEEADKYGYFYVVKEIELFEISVVSFGMNTLTPYLGSKSKDKNKNIIKDSLDRIDLIKAQLKSSLDKKVRKEVDLQVLQLKQILSELEIKEPSKKTTQHANESGTKETKKGPITINSLSKFI